jgi:hypothetical protein
MGLDIVYVPPKIYVLEAWLSIASPIQYWLGDAIFKRQSLEGILGSARSLFLQLCLGPHLSGFIWQCDLFLSPAFPQTAIRPSSETKHMGLCELLDFQPLKL